MMICKGARYAILQRREISNFAKGRKMRYFSMEEKTMKLKNGFVLREVAGQIMVVATGEASKDFHGMIRLNETGKLVWEGIAEGKTADEIAEGMTKIFSVDRERALADVKALIAKMEAAGILLS